MAVKAKVKPSTGSAKKKPAAGKAKKAGKSEKLPSIKFTATIGKIESNSRGTNITLVVPLDKSAAVAQLMQSKIPDQYLDIIAVVRKVVKNAKAKNGKRRDRKRRRWNYQS
jgi:hypothetical protein